MNETCEGPGADFFSEYIEGVRIGVAGMHDQRQSGLARRRRMDAEARPLKRAGGVIVVIVEPGLADADDLVRPGVFDEDFRRRRRLVIHIVGMDSDRAIEVVVGPRQGQHIRELGEPRADRLHDADAGLGGARQHPIDVVGELGKIEMAMAVDQHQPAPSSASST